LAESSFRRARFKNRKMVYWTTARVLLALTVAVASTSAFVGPPSKASHSLVSTSTSPTKLFGNTQQPPMALPVTDISYGEESRKYRRTVYTHDDWVKHRSPDRFWKNLRTTVNSGIYKNIGNEVAVATAVACVVIVWNALVGGYVDFEGVKQAGVLQGDNLPMLGLPLTPFTLSSPSLGLLLGKIERLSNPLL
jgi:ion channel-forming bestrophin family protein